MEIEIPPQYVVTAAGGNPLQSRETPERARLRAEVASLRGSLNEVTHRAEESNAELYANLTERAQQALAHQRAGFQVAAGQYEREARDVIQAEVASERSRVTLQAHQQVMHASRQVRDEQAQLV